jgi:hypothetical protein
MSRSPRPKGTWRLTTPRSARRRWLRLAEYSSDRSGATQHAAFEADRRRVHHATALQTRPRRLPANTTARLVADKRAAHGEPVAERYLALFAYDVAKQCPSSVSRCKSFAPRPPPIMMIPMCASSAAA